MDSIFGMLAGLGVLALALLLGISALVLAGTQPSGETIVYKAQDRLSLQCGEE